MSDLLKAALDYAARGWPVLPLRPCQKIPHGKLAAHGLYDATTDADQIHHWWSEEPNGNVGLATGHMFDALDVDSPDALERLMIAGPPGAVGTVDGLPVGEHDIEGPTVASPRGWHVYLRPTGRGNTVRVGGIEGVDWRGRGGYVVAPPSVREDGGTWTWITGTSLDLGPDTQIVSAPGWLLDLLDNPRVPTDLPAVVTRHVGRTGYGAAALDRELGRLVQAPEGTRNDTLVRAAFRMGQLVTSHALDIDEAYDALVLAAVRVGLPDTEARRTVESGMTEGLRSPRRVAS